MRPNRLMLPIQVGLDPMERLLVATFAGDPEFVSMEPQVFDDPVNGKGMRVLRYRRDGRVDVYCQPEVRVDRSTFVLGAGLADVAEVTIDPARFDITDRGVDLDVAFTDLQNRRNRLRIRGNATGKRGFPMLAPVGDAIERPLQLFLAYLPEIDLVRRGQTQFDGHVGNRTLRVASLPMFLHGHRPLFVRYAERPVIGTLNPPMIRPVVVEVAAPGVVDIGGMSVFVDRAGSVARMSAGEGPRCVEVDAVPAFPNLLELPCGATASGRWSVRISGIPITGGSYRVMREGIRACVELDVLEHWRPSGLPLSMELFTRVVRSFRTWPSTYRWRGTVELGDAPTMSAAWERARRGGRAQG